MRRAPFVLPVAIAGLLLAGCGSSAGTAPPTGGPTTAPAPTGLALDVTVVGKKVTPAPATIDARPGEQFTLTLTTDRSGELHVHAADPELETQISPGTKTFTFAVATQPGVYEAELHDPDLLLFQVKVQ